MDSKQKTADGHYSCKNTPHGRNAKADFLLHYRKKEIRSNKWRKLKTNTKVLNQNKPSKHGKQVFQSSMSRLRKRTRQASSEQVYGWAVDITTQTIIVGQNKDRSASKMPKPKLTEISAIL